MRKIILLAIVTLNFSSLVAQSSTYWQQHVDYKMDVTMDVKTTIQGKAGISLVTIHLTL
jgi:hypothetical protein